MWRINMKILFLLKCFALGISAVAGVGPIFILTFNRGALKGFGRGLATALGAALGDALLFFLGLVGLLSILEGSKNMVLLLDLIGGVALVIMGTKMLHSTPTYIHERLGGDEPYLGTIFRSFLLTVINPLAIIFFLIVSVQILPAGQIRLPFNQIIAASLTVGLGSLTALAAIAFVASRLGKSLSIAYLLKVSYITGVIFIGIGIYFFSDVVTAILRLFT